MTSRNPRLPLLVVVVLALSGCSAAAGTDDTASAPVGSIEFAVSETCTDEASPNCVAINGEKVVPPSVFERADVEDATIAEGAGQNAVDVTFNDEGAMVFHALTDKAIQAGETGRLVIKIGGEIQAAVRVMEATKDDHVQLSASPENTAQEIVDLIRKG